MCAWPWAITIRVGKVVIFIPLWEILDVLSNKVERYVLQLQLYLSPKGRQKRQITNTHRQSAKMSWKLLDISKNPIVCIPGFFSWNYFFFTVRNTLWDIWGLPSVLQSYMSCSAQRIHLQQLDLCTPSTVVAQGASTLGLWRKLISYPIIYPNMLSPEMLTPIQLTQILWTFSSSESFVLTRWTVPTLALQFQQHILFIIIFPSLPLFFLLNNVDAALTFIFCLSKYNQNWMLNSSEESWGLGHCRLQTCPFN